MIINHNFATERVKKYLHEGKEKLEVKLDMFKMGIEQEDKPKEVERTRDIEEGESKE